MQRNKTRMNFATYDVYQEYNQVDVTPNIEDIKDTIRTIIIISMVFTRVVMIYIVYLELNYILSKIIIIVLI